MVQVEGTAATGANGTEKRESGAAGAVEDGKAPGPGGCSPGDRREGRRQDLHEEAALPQGRRRHDPGDEDPRLLRPPEHREGRYPKP